MINNIYEMDRVTKEIIQKESFDLFLLAGGSDYRAYEIMRIMKSENVSILPYQV